MHLDADLPPPLLPLAWLIGRWAGAGVVGYPTMDSVNFGQELEITHDGRPFLRHQSQSWLLDESGAKVRPLATELGFWRPQQTRPAQVPGEPAETDIELLLTHPTGYLEMYVGAAIGPRITLQTDVVARAPSAKPYTAASRMYGLVGGDLMWVMDMSAMNQPLQSHASAQLKKLGP
ncbi:MAG: FABP family protein [Angustibacter sp.]